MQKSKPTGALHQRSRSFQMNTINAACTLMLLSGGLAHAQATKPVAEVTVTGLRGSIEASVMAKKASDSIIEVVTAEELGKLPDASIAESLARMPGLTGQRGPDGRVNVISIRGLSPAYSGALLNGREVVSSGDGRAVEYDQFPSELIGSAVVYKTPDASLIGQGLSGTVDIRTRNPLDTRGREVVVSVKGEQNSNGTLVKDVASPLGKRFSMSYVDQFDDNKIGVALGFARMDVATQVKQSELVSYGDFTPYGLPFTGTVPSLYAPKDAWFGKGQAMLPMFWTATSSTKQNIRDGLMGVFEFKPNADLHSKVDLYYSQFNTHEVGSKFLETMYGNWGAGITTNLVNPVTTQIGQNTFTTSATAERLPVTTGNMDTTRKDNIFALGWNTKYKLDKNLTAIADVSMSRDTRQENYSEVYAAPFNTQTQQWMYGNFKWNVPVNGAAQTFTPVTANYLSNPAIIKLGDQQAFDFVGDQPAYTGAVRTPKIKDEIKSVRLSLKRTMDGAFTDWVGGVNYTQRDKDVSKNEARILMKLDANGNYIRDIPATALRSPNDMSWAGIPSMIRIDVPALVASGAFNLQPLFSQKVDNDSNVSEKVLTAFTQLNIDTNVSSIPVRGNMGFQVVHTNQKADGWEYRGNNATPDINLLFKREGGTSYTDVLPSLNLVGDFSNSILGRFGLAKTMARPNIVDMRAGTSTPYVQLGTTNINGSGIGRGVWSTAYSGNPELEPWRATSIDLSLEKYFGKRSYVSGALFRKNLLTTVYNQLTSRDNSSFPVVLPPGVTAGNVDRFGPVMQPMNGKGGMIEGLELSAALEGPLLSDSLNGFGLVVSASKLNSSMRERNSDGTESNNSINGLSGLSNNVTVYYENNGWSARLSQRYRSPFTATTRDIFLNSTTRQQAADKVADMQLGYAFNDGPYKGMSIIFQVYNLTNKTTTNLVTPGDNAPDKSMLLPNYTYGFGRVSVLGATYKF